MRWLVLYARSRRLALVLVVFVAGALLPRQVERVWGEGPGPLAFTLALGMVVACGGLASADISLERTASFGWPPRRAGHLIGLAAVAMVVSLSSTATVGVIVRDAAGLAGLAGIGATLFGRSFGWCAPFAPLLVTYLPGAAEYPVLTWLVRPGDSVPAAVTAAVLGGAGLLSYAAFGCRR
jgi:hypothetical protein